MAMLFSSIFSSKDKTKLVGAITEAEKKTSGEIRLYMEAKCTDDPLDRAVEVFENVRNGSSKWNFDLCSFRI